MLARILLLAVYLSSKHMTASPANSKTNDTTLRGREEHRAYVLVCSHFITRAVAELGPRPVRP